MAKTYYKYAERQAEQQIDWSVVGKTISDTLMDVNKVREEKKAAIDENTRNYMKYVQESPQGQFQDGNKFTNQFAHDMMEQQLIDSKLLKSGQMKLQDYTLRRQNYKDGTDTLFSLSKMYQDVYKQRMDNLMSGKSQAINGANMALVEGFADFSKSKAFINPTSGEVNIGMMKMNEKTGQIEIDENSMVPVNVLKGKIQAEIPTFDVEGEMNKSVKGLGNVIRTIYNKADRSTYGTIEKLTGILSLVGAKTKIPDEFKPEIDQFNKAIDQTINGYFADDYHLTSVLTQNIGGKYSQQSFTYNRDEADADPSKILLMINPNTGLGTIDKSAKNFKAQDAEARDWVKTQITSKLTNEREKVTTATTPYGPQASSASIEAGEQGRKVVNAAQSIGALWGGDDTQISSAVEALGNMNPNIKGFNRTQQGVDVKILNSDGKIETRSISFYSPNKTLLTQEQFIKAASPLLLGNVDINKALNSGGYIKGATFEPYYTKEWNVNIEGPTEKTGIPEDYDQSITGYVDAVIKPSLVEDDAIGTSKRLNDALKGLKFRVTGKRIGGFLGGGKDDIITITGGNKVSKDFNIDDNNAFTDIENFIYDNVDDKDKAFQFLNNYWTEENKKIDAAQAEKDKAAKGAAKPKKGILD